MILVNKLREIRDKLLILIFQLKKICVNSINNIPMQIDRIVVGQDKLKIFLSEVVEYEIDENDLKYQNHINDNTFYSCLNLTNITIPDGIISIGNSAFVDCQKLANVIIPDSVTTIGSSAFYGCKTFTSITIPYNVTVISGHAFYNCMKLKNMYLRPTTPPALGDTRAISTATTAIHVPIGSGEAYRTATNWSTFADIIVEDIEI